MFSKAGGVGDVIITVERGTLQIRPCQETHRQKRTCINTPPHLCCHCKPNRDSQLGRENMENKL
jgi:hypothetical protein